MGSIKDAVDRDIRQGLLQLCKDPRLEGMYYYADRKGRIVSYNRDRPREITSKPGGGGLLWCTLYRKDGGVISCSVSELVACAFLGPRPTTEHQVSHLDGDTTNLGADNLEWALHARAAAKRTEPPEAGTQREGIAVESRHSTTGPPIPEPERSIASSSPPDRQTVTQLRRALEEAMRRHQQLLDALRPFAEFELPPALLLAGADRMVLEAGGTARANNRLWVSDFKRAAETCRAK